MIYTPHTENQITKGANTNNVCTLYKTKIRVQVGVCVCVRACVCACVRACVCVCV